VTREEIEQKMDELAREYYETHDPEIQEEIFELARGDGALKGRVHAMPLTHCFSVWHYLSDFHRIAT
jgi:hypothetical protein